MLQSFSGLPKHYVWPVFLHKQCLPAWQAQIAPSACQWLGVAKDTACISLSSNTFCISHSVNGFSPPLSITILERGSKNCSSVSQRVVNRTLWLSLNLHHASI